jgi:cytochrome P450
MKIRRAFKKFIVPVIEERIAQKDGPVFKRHLDTILLMVEMPPARPKETDTFRQAIRILHLHFASTDSTIRLLYNCLWQLLQTPESMGQSGLRSEMCLPSMGHLHSLDSFIREVLRSMCRLQVSTAF